MSSSLGSTFSSGVQDVSAILPLVGTEQCESHITSGLERGFLYPAATTLSIFGSLGAAKAGLMIVIASSRFRIKTRWKWLNFEINGAEILKNTGFGASEEDGLSAILLQRNESGTGFVYGIEKRLEKLAETKNVKFAQLDQHEVNAVSATYTWNVWLILSSALLSMLGIVPYIHLNLRGNTPHSTLLKWLFPSIRVLGSFFVAVGGQFVMQHRILTILRRKLIAEAKLKPAVVHSGLRDELKRALKGTGNHVDEYLQVVLDQLDESLGNRCPSADVLREWPILSYPSLTRALLDAEERPLTTVLFWGVFLFYLPWVLVLIGSCLIVAGYVGCFSIVQGTTSPSAPLIWLGLEIFLSLLRMFFWACDPKTDEKAGVSFRVSSLDCQYLPTCIDYAEYLEETKTLPLTGQADFFECHLIPYLGTSATSEIIRTQADDCVFFYTITRHSRDDPRHRLYLTIRFKGDGVDRPTIVIYDDNASDTLICRRGTYLPAKEPANINDPPAVAKIGEEVGIDDMIADEKLLSEIKLHHKAILKALEDRTETLRRNQHSWIMKWNLMKTLKDEHSAKRDSTVEARQGNSASMELRTSLLADSRDNHAMDVVVAEIQSDDSENSTGLTIELQETYYLSLGTIQHDGQRQVKRMEQWIDCCLQNPTKKVTEKWLVGLERRLAAEWASIEREFLREHTLRLKRLSEAIKNPESRFTFEARLKKYQIRQVSSRRDAAIKRRETRVAEIIKDLKSRDLLSPKMTAVADRNYAATWVGPEWIQASKSVDSDDGAFIRVLHALKGVEWSWDLGLEEVPIGERLLEYLDDFNPQFDQPEQSDRSFKEYVIDNKEIESFPDLIIRRHRDIMVRVMLNADLTDERADEEVIRSCIQSLVDSDNLASIFFGELGLRGAKGTTIEALASLITRENTSIESVWFKKPNVGDRSQNLKDALLRIVANSPGGGSGRDRPLLVFTEEQGPSVQFRPSDGPDLKDTFGATSLFRINFLAPRRGVVKSKFTGQVYLQVNIKPFGKDLQVLVWVCSLEPVRYDGRGYPISPGPTTCAMSKPETADNMTMIVPIQPLLTWGKMNTLQVSVTNAWVLDVRLEGRIWQDVKAIGKSLNKPLQETSPDKTEADSDPDAGTKQLKDAEAGQSNALAFLSSI